MPSDYKFNQEQVTKELQSFFKNEKSRLDSFGKRVNQTFEAYTFALTIKWYKSKGWSIQIINPVIKRREIFKLKFSTRGAPKNYSHARCLMGNASCLIWHQLRVSTRAHRDRDRFKSNICCDVAVTKDLILDSFSTEDPLSNDDLISFCEVKHMSAFAELIASFIGLVYELQPNRLKRIRRGAWRRDFHISPFLNVSGILYPTAKGLKETIKRRGFDIDVYDHESKLSDLSI